MVKTESQESKVEIWKYIYKKRNILKKKKNKK